MNERSLIGLVLAACAILLLVGVVFSARITDGISAAARQEATQHAAVPTPPALAHAKPAPAKSAPAHA